jgi:hypothetical protein
MLQVEDHRPLHELTSSERLKHALKFLPPLPFDRPYFTEFHVLDTTCSKVIVTQRMIDNIADQPAEGIRGFHLYFQNGVILPNGEVLVSNGVLGWRMAVLEYHGGWYITILNGVGSRSTHFPISAHLWAAMLGEIEDVRLRCEALDKMMRIGVTGTSMHDYLLYVHGIHRNHTLHSPSHDKPSVISLIT